MKHYRTKEYHAEWRAKNVVSGILSRARQRAKRQNLHFTISQDDITIPTHCPVLGIKLAVSRGHAKDGSPSLDRINPKKGYIPGNVTVMSNRANQIKSNGSADEHLLIAKWLQEHGT